MNRLSQEPSYSLRIGKELGLSQQLVSSHLRTMEDAGLIEAELQESTRGPKRKVYSLSKSLLITIEIAPRLFDLKMISFDTTPDSAKLSKSSSKLLEDFESISTSAEEGQIGDFAELLHRIDMRLDKIDKERAVLLFIRNRVVQNASKIVKQIDEPNARRVLYCIMDSPDETIRSISNKLNLREETVRSILNELERDYVLPSK